MFKKEEAKLWGLGIISELMDVVLKKITFYKAGNFAPVEMQSFQTFSAVPLRYSNGTGSN